MEPPVLAVPARGLVVLIGAAGAGKTTFARRRFAPTEILSSDAFRAMITDDETDQAASGPAFDLLARVLALRLRRGRLCVVDATNTAPRDRAAALRLASLARRPAVAIALDPPEEICQERNRLRPGRSVDPAVVRRHVVAVRRSLADPDRLRAEGFTAVHVLRDADAIEAAVVVREDGLAPVPARTAATSGRRPRGRTA